MFAIVECFGAIEPLQLIGVADLSISMFSFDGIGALSSFHNVPAAFLEAVNLIAKFNLSSALVEGSCMFIGLVGLSWRPFRKKWTSVQPMSLLTGQGVA